MLGLVQDRGSEFDVGGGWRGSPSYRLANEVEAEMNGRNNIQVV